MAREHFSIRIARCKSECLTLALTRFLFVLDWFSAAILLQQIWPVTWSKLKNCTIVVTKVWRATRPSSLPQYEPAFIDISKNEPRRVLWLDLQTKIHPVPLTVLAFSLSICYAYEGTIYQGISYPFHVGVPLFDILPHPFSAEGLQELPERDCQRSDWSKMWADFSTKYLFL
jgi:hypothetical protein